ncbi:acetoacetate decarboxylase family protein [Shewanella surugensis]|uniref:Acetoacetate decarboxylase family protein n=1 Tax=Shewanella surugensis TaxID=212020 RepID=A0ABT0L5Q6_9GAMM|nr:acetoacetate decarboxylase family protein [Shewanella surugensis]MCL1123017.1 acetoacetate decarboxylase family protein [Shewanella surugensis]
MDVNLKINPELLSNEEKFNNNFFKRFHLRHAEQPLQLNENIEKNYQFPTFYADASCAIAIFHCDYAAAKAMMPDPSMEPVKMTKGRSLVIFSCYEYRHVMNVAPYNEIAITIPVVSDGGMNLPILTMLLGDKLKNFGYYVFHMPVTSLENRLRGRKIWGLPKEVEQINITKDEQSSKIEASIDGQAPYLTLSIPTQGQAQSFDVKSNLLSVLNSNRLKSTTQFKGTFNLNKNMKTLLTKSDVGNGINIQLGDGPMADKLKALKIEQHAFQYRYTDNMNACFDLPHETRSC